MSLASTQLCSTGPYPSQSSKYSTSPALLRDLRILFTMLAGSLSISRGSGGKRAGLTSSRGPAMTGFRK